MIHCRGSDLRTPTSSVKQGNIKRPTVYSLGLFCLKAFPYGMIEGEYRDVAQLVARTAGGGEAAGSSPVIPTMAQ